MSAFELAQMLADAAAALDFNKNSLDDAQRIQAQALVRDMHKLAQELAAWRVNEIYAEEEEA